MPYKIDIIPYLDALEPEAQIIGAVNCIYRENEKLVGTNTDGAGALWSLEQTYGKPLTGKTVLVLGTGGAGLAVASYIASAIGPQGTLLVANRTKDSRERIVQKLGNQCQVKNIEHWPVTADDVKEADILVNCTSIGFETVKQDGKGFYNLKYFTPLGPVDDAVRIPDQDQVDEQFPKAAQTTIDENLKSTSDILSQTKQPLVFDIIYQPKETVLLNQAKKAGCKTLNGLPMNLEQAVIAFVKAAGCAGLYDGDCDKVRSIMSEAR
jgi:shikimate dehydrogenase